MDQAHIKAILAGVIPELKTAISAQTKPLIERIEALEKREPLNGRDGKDGRDGEKGETGPQGEAGTAGPQGPQGERGADGVSYDQMVESVGLQIAKWFVENPIPRGEKGDPGERGIDGKDGKDGINGRDGLPGIPGRDGKNGADGAAGKDGADGLGVQDMDVLYDGKRTFVFKWSNGDRVEERSFRTPLVIDAGVWKGGPHEAGDQVTFGGHLWVAKKDTDKQPDTSPDDWRMAVRKPRDGRDGKPGERGIQGPKGDRGDAGPRAYSG